MSASTAELARPTATPSESYYDEYFNPIDPSTGPEVEATGNKILDAVLDLGSLALDSAGTTGDVVATDALDAGVIPPLDISTVDVSDKINEHAQKYLLKPRFQARELKDARNKQRELDKKDIETGIASAKLTLDEVKKARSTTRLKDNAITRFMRSAELQGQYQREVQDRIDNGDLKNVSEKVRKAHMKGAKSLAKTEARAQVESARSKANENVFAARGEISSFKARGRDLKVVSRKGTRNTYFENRKTVLGGFDIGALGASGMSDEQKKLLDERMKSKLSNKRTATHTARGRSSTRKAAQLLPKHSLR
jgi:hypothetical protein